MKTYVVELAAGTRVTTVIGEDVEAAREQARDTLSRPGRYAIYLAWRDGGKRIRDEETNQVYVL